MRKSPVPPLPTTSLEFPRLMLAQKVEICLPYVDYFMPNYEESIMIAGISDRRDILRYFLDRGAKHVVLKLGAGGSSVGFYDNGRLEEIRIAKLQSPGRGFNRLW